MSRIINGKINQHITDKSCFVSSYAQVNAILPKDPSQHSEKGTASQT